jgi:hypothetical protein
MLLAESHIPSLETDVVKDKHRLGLGMWFSGRVLTKYAQALSLISSTTKNKNNSTKWA